MRRLDVRSGVIYAYQHEGTHSTDPVSPITFLSFTDFGRGPKALHELWRDRHGKGNFPTAFVRADLLSSPRIGLASNSGAIGYPAAKALFPGISPSEEDLAALRKVTMDDFKRAIGVIYEGHIRFLVVTSLRRVVGPWGE